MYCIRIDTFVKWLTTDWQIKTDGSTTMAYTHVLKVAAGGIASPLDALQTLHI
jgi:hypothetical protein